MKNPLQATAEDSRERRGSTLDATYHSRLRQLRDLAQSDGPRVVAGPVRGPVSHAGTLESEAQTKIG